MSGGTESWCVSLAVPEATLPMFEAVLDGLGGATVSGALEGDPARSVQLQVYLSAPPDPGTLDELLGVAAEAAGIVPPVYSIEALGPRDWVAQSQAALPPIRTRRFWVHGSHVETPAPPGARPLLIEAATAFGTGRHESTLGCLLSLERLARARRFRRVLDMGCGSGILSLVAARLWPRARVLGIDNDAGSVAVARGNAAANRLTRQARFAVNDGYRAGRFRGEAPFDLVIANILARPLAAMAPDLRRRLAPGGTAMLAGLLSSQERLVLAPHEGLGIRLVGRLKLGDWSILVLRG